VRRIVATLLVVASPGLMAVPADAGETRAAVPTAPTAAPAVPAPVPVAVPAVPEVVAPVAPAPVAVTPAVPAPAKAAAAVRPFTRTVTARTRVVTDADDAAYAARLQAELCHARAVFCGLDRGGRYPAS
jgi:uncharacterized membrane protein